MASVGALAATLAVPVLVFAATYIQDTGNMFSQQAKTAAQQQIDGLVQRTGKQILVYTIPALNGRDASQMADDVFSGQKINGVLLFMSAQDRQLEIKIDDASRQTITPSRETQIRDTMLSDFRQNEYDQGLKDGVDLIRADFTASGGATRTATGPNRVAIAVLIVGLLLGALLGARLLRARGRSASGVGREA